jgi:hypothetical protein
MKSIALALIACLGSFAAMSQSFAELDNRRGDNAFEENTFEVMIRRTQVSGKFTESFGGTTFNMRFRSEGYEKGDGRWHFENPTLGDMLFVVTNLVRGNDVTVRTTEQSFSSGFFGWHQIHMNVIATDKLLISPGLSLGDYIFASKRATTGPNVPTRVIEPAGYYFHLGPAFMASYVVTPRMWVDAFMHYDIGFRAGKLSGEFTETPGYARPHFLNLGTNVRHAGTRLFGGLRYSHLIDRGPHKDAATRVDISFGYMF